MILVVDDMRVHQEAMATLLNVDYQVKVADTIARIGGDEFVVLLPDLNHANEYKVTVKWLLETIALPVCIQDQSFFLTASIGVSIFPDDNCNWDGLLRHADRAMYIAKESGKNRYHLYASTNNQ